jgi:tetratricopeptide (TPR) repeat protein
MIRAVADQDLQPRSLDPTSDKPIVLVPVTEADVTRARRKKIALGIFVTFVVAAGAWYSYQRVTNPINARQSYEDGLRLMTANHYEESILNFDRTIKLTPEFADAYKMRGKSYVAASKVDEGIDDFSHFLALRPADAEAFTDRGFAYVGKKDWAKAAADANHALELNAKLGRAYTLRATVNRETGNLQKAIEDFTHAIEVEPNLDNYFQRASTYQLLGEAKLAAQDLDRAVEFSPDQTNLYFARARSRAAAGDLKGAKEDIQYARKIEGW